MKNRNTHIYTIGFIILSAVFTSTVLLYYSYLLEGLVPPSNVFREYVICFGQMVFQGILLITYRQKSELMLLYLKNMMMVSLIGALLLLPLLIILFYIEIYPITCLAYFFSIVIIMFFNHKARVKKINAPWWLSYTWVLYRFIVLLFIL
jgi:hypothetical protein